VYNAGIRAGKSATTSSTAHKSITHVKNINTSKKRIIFAKKDPPGRQAFDYCFISAV